MTWPPGAAALVTAVGLVTAAAGLVVGVWVIRPDLPRDLVPAADVREVAVGWRDIDDDRVVALVVAPGVGRELTAPAPGRVTSTSCTEGGDVVSGDTMISIDGEVIISLALAVPPWRDLQVGDRGDDVAALHAELSRLGYGTLDGDVVNRSTTLAYRALAARSGAVVPHDGVPLSRTLWLPEDHATVGSCTAAIGDRVETSDPVATSAGTPRAALVEVPPTAAPGDRDVVVGALRIPIGAGGAVEDPAALTALLASDDYRAASADDEGVRRLSARWVLRAPLAVAIVPPGAVGGDGVVRACVRDAQGASTPVGVVGSQLGQSYVLPEAGYEMPSRVLLGTASDVGCA